MKPTPAEDYDQSDESSGFRQDLAMAPSVAALEQMPCAVVMAEASTGRVTWCNAATSRLLGTDLSSLSPYFLRALQGEAIAGEELLWASEKSAGKWFTVTAGLVVDNNGQTSGAVCTLQEILSSRVAEDRLRTSLEQRDAQLRLVMNNVPALLSYIDCDQVYRRVNRTYKDWIGLEPDQIVGRTLGEIIGEPHRTNAQPKIAEALAGKRVSYDSQMRFKDGELHDIWVEYTPDTAPDGSVHGFVALVQDITERKRSALEREQALRKLSGVLSSMAEGLIVADVTGAVLDVNPAALRIFGFDSVEQAREPLGDPRQHFQVFALNGEPVPAEELPIARVLRGERVIDAEYRIVRPDSGREFIASINGTAVFDRPGRQVLAILTIRDVTQRKKDEEALRRASQRLRLHLENTPLGLVDFDAGFRIVRWSRRAAELFGWAPDEVLGKRPEEFRWIHEEEAEAVAAMRDLQAGRVPFQVLHMRNYRKDGSVVHCQWYNSALFGTDGKLESILALALDTTERVQAVEELRLSEERFRVALEGSPVIVFNHDKDLRYTWIRTPMGGVNARDLVGRTDEEVVGAGGDATSLVEFKRRVLETGVAERQELNVRADDEERYFDIQMVPLRDAAGNVSGLTGTAVETTGRRQMENALRESNAALQRANAELEEFAYVASHDLQEPLRTIHVYTQLLLRRYPLEAGGDAERYAMFVQHGVQRIESLIRDLLSYSRTVRPPEEDAHEVRADDALDEAIAMLEQQIGETGAEITREPLPGVIAENAQVAVVFQNLISNALKYRRDTGTPRVHVSATCEGGVCTFSVRDNGIGFDPRYSERIFGLFKRLHRQEYPGTGLGLAICKRIVERFGGRIWAESQPGDGAVFHFSLPAA